MSEIHIDSVIAQTQDKLGKYVKKPVLSEKLLKKPPFRFLHDVFNAVIRNTGYFEGLYTAEELNVENIKDREGKMHFLQKMIDTIKIVTNEPLSIRASKIVAGHEPDKTNQLLQYIGNVIDNKLDWKSAVHSVNTITTKTIGKSKSKENAKEKKATGKSTDKPPAKPKDTKRAGTQKRQVKSESTEKLNPRAEKHLKEQHSKSNTSVDHYKKDEKRSKSKVPSKESIKKFSPENLQKKSIGLVESTKQIQPDSLTRLYEDIDSKIEEPDNEKHAVDNKPERIVHEIIIPLPPPVQLPAELKTTREERPASKKAKEILLAAAAEDDSVIDSRQSTTDIKRPMDKIRRPSAEKYRAAKLEEMNSKMLPEQTDSLQTVTEELTGTAAPSNVQSQIELSPAVEVKRESTFVRENSRETSENASRPRTSLRPPSARPASARPGAPRRRDKNVEIILQPNDQVKMSGISIKLESFASELEDDGENLVIIEDPLTGDPMQESLGNLGTKVDDDPANKGHLVQQILETQKELVQGGTLEPDQKADKDYEMSKLSNRQSSARQMNSLRDIIQNLTKSVNPLGKLMDFIPEDIDAMQLELTMWRDVYNQASVELKKERSLTESVTEPMKNQLITIEANNQEYQDMIDECRAKILQNAEKIQRLFTTQ